MKIWYDITADLIFIEGMKQVYPARSLQAVVEDNKLAIYFKESTTCLVSSLPFTALTDNEGNSFSNILDAFTYMVEVFNSSNLPDINFVEIFENQL